MPDDTTPLVQGDQTPESVANATPSGAGVTATPVTPVQAPLDAEALKEQIANELKQKYERDVAQVKSSLQSREAQVLREAQQRERALQDELRKVQMASMDDETRKEYEHELALQRANELEQQLSEINNQFETYRATQDAVQHFRGLGVPDDVLIMNGSFDDLLRSGWDWVTYRLTQLQSSPQTPPVTPPPAPLPVAPKVDTGGAATPASTRPTWKDWEAKLSLEPGEDVREKVYQLFQQGRISRDQLPIN